MACFPNCWFIICPSTLDGSILGRTSRATAGV
jgi:hypothetical protein